MTMTSSATDMTSSVDQINLTFDLEDGSSGNTTEGHFPLFCEMIELKPNKKCGLEPEWREVARWIKFEEDVEEQGKRWSKPYVASLSLHSLMELRNSLSTGSLLLDLPATSLSELWTAVVDTWISADSVDAELKKPLISTLSQRYRHFLQWKRGSLTAIDDVNLVKNSKKTVSDFLQLTSFNLANKDKKEKVQCRSAVTLQEVTGDPDQLYMQEKTPNIRLFKKLPPEAQAASIMIAELEFLTKPLYMFIRLREATTMENLIEVPVQTRFLFVLLGPKTTSLHYRQIGRTMGTLFSDELFQGAIYKASNRRDILNAVDEFLSAVTVLPPGEWDPEIRIEPPKRVQTIAARRTEILKRQGSEELVDPKNDSPALHGFVIKRTGRIFGGLIEDVKGKIPFYFSDFRDALSSQCLASFIFLYFASMAPLITFGALMSDLLKQRMGAMETILARALSGVVWGFTAGQPIVILGSTGPILVYELIVFQLCESFSLDYMSFRVWIGLWSMVHMLAIVAFDLSFMVSFITRFTEESFAALVSVIFVYEAVQKLLHIAEEDPVRFHPDTPVVFCPPITENNTARNNSSTNSTNPDCISNNYVPDAFFVSVLLFFGTYLVAFLLRLFKNSSFFPSKIRQIFSDFAVIISIAIFVGIDYAMGIPTPKLSVPEKLEPSYSGREGSWIVPFFAGNPWWTALAAFIPGLLATILIFMDQQITAVIVNRKENRLVKGKGYHLDLLVVSLLTGVLSILGMPWMVADTVLSLTHVSSLKMESEVAAPGECPTFLGVREQRVTNILISVVIGVSIFMTAVLKIIPMPVLFGVFLFMGLNALNGLQFTDRIKLFFMPLKHQPDYTYLRHVKISRVHLFTVIQMICFAILWILKSFNESSMLFPLMVGALAGVRKLLDFVFTQYELGYLDDIMPENVKRKEDDIKRRKSLAPVRLHENDDVSQPDAAAISEDGSTRISIELHTEDHSTVLGESPDPGTIS